MIRGSGWSGSTIGRYLVVLALALSGCKPKELLRASTLYAAMTHGALDHVAGAPGIVTGLCQRRAQLNYVAKQLTVPPQPPEAAVWVDACRGYAIAEGVVDESLQAMGAYAAALGRVAQDDDDSLKADVQAGSESVINGLAELSRSDLAAEHKTTLAKLGNPFGSLGLAVRDRWKAKELGKIVRQADPHIQEAVRVLRAYVETIRSSQLVETRRSYDVLRLQLDSKLVPLHDVALVAELARADARLSILARLLGQIGSAHAALANGWTQGSDAGRETLRVMRDQAELIAEDARAFQRIGLR